jgi:hypothetical protein
MVAIWIHDVRRIVAVERPHVTVVAAPGTILHTMVAIWIHNVAGV